MGSPGGDLPGRVPWVRGSGVAAVSATRLTKTEEPRP